MNFDFLPLIHDSVGVWVAVLLMAVVALGLLLMFRRKRYLDRRDLP
jgi:magnesium transporter